MGNAKKVRDDVSDFSIASRLQKQIRGIEKSRAVAPDARAPEAFLNLIQAALKEVTRAVEDIRTGLIHGNDPHLSAQTFECVQKKVDESLREITEIARQPVMPSGGLLDARVLTAKGSKLTFGLPEVSLATLGLDQISPLSDRRYDSVAKNSALVSEASGIIRGIVSAIDSFRSRIDFDRESVEEVSVAKKIVEAANEDVRRMEDLLR